MCTRMIRPNFHILSAQGLLLLCALSYFGARGPYAEAEPDAIPGADIFSNHSLNWTGVMPLPLLQQLTCQSFQCSGERCYQDEAHGNNSQLCHNASHCELYRLNSTSYTARCSSDCGSANATEMCLQSGGPGRELCFMECCNSSDCLQLNATAYGDMALTTTPVPITTTTTTTTAAPPRNGKVCSSFTCHGEGCYKRQKSSTNCIVGHDFCEMKKTGVHFVAGCSQHCKTKGHPCTRKSTAACYQECCQAMPKTSCLKLDGKVHFNRASSLTSASLLQLLGWASLLSLSCSLSFLAGIN
ncbi:uncharacterized protein LOC120301681 [Crotalus tigris]|uniref:uncharacterized protein LOC120301681 n=1 Tax=Crotalus tigris TaxID=88082 RepID=UPI00192FB23B|nr:uncharacterized protein LOC120301681 [Crotalus tigris]